jgi:hypothetical protein
MNIAEAPVYRSPQRDLMRGHGLRYRLHGDVLIQTMRSEEPWEITSCPWCIPNF